MRKLAIFFGETIENCKKVLRGKKGGPGAREMVAKKLKGTTNLHYRSIKTLLKSLPNRYTH